MAVLKSIIHKLHVFLARAHLKPVIGMAISLCVASISTQVTAATTGTWTAVGTTGSTSTVSGITVTATGSTAISPASGTMNTTNYWTNPYLGAVAGATDLNYVVTPGTGSVTFTFTFNKAVNNPVLHMQRLGGAIGTLTNSSSWQLIGSNLGTLPTMTRLSGNPQFQVTSNTFFRTPNVTSSGSTLCTSALGATADDGGTACGSVQINGTGITSLTYTVTTVGSTGADGLDLMWSIGTPAIAIKKQSVGGTGNFTFTGTNGAPTTSLNTATSNPITSADGEIVNQTTSATVAESATAGFALTGAACVDPSSATVPTTLAGSTLTIPSSSYVANGTLTCTFTNSKIPTVAVQKTTVGGVGGPFTFTQTNLASATAGITTTTAGTPAPATPTAINVTTIGTAVTLTETLASGYALTSASCTDANSATTGNTGSIGTLSTNVLTIPAANVTAGSAYTCVFTNTKLVPLLSLAKSAPTPSLTVGSNSTYTLTVTNSGSAAATTAQVQDLLPAGMTFVSAIGTNWSCANASGTVTCNFSGGSIAGSGGTSTIAVVVAPTVAIGGTSVTNYGSVDPTGGA